MPFLEDVDNNRQQAEEMQNEIDNQIGDVLDPAGVQEAEDCEEIGIAVHPEFSSRNPGELTDLQPTQIQADKVLYRKIPVSDQKELAAETKELDNEQREVINIGIRYAKQLVQSRESKTKLPEPPKLFIHGGAGSGKSKVINLLSQWMEFIL